jgi:hypothetical protein
MGEVARTGSGPERPAVGVGSRYTHACLMLWLPGSRDREAYMSTDRLPDFLEGSGDYETRESSYQVAADTALGDELALTTEDLVGFGDYSLETGRWVATSPDLARGFESHHPHSSRPTLNPIWLADRPSRNRRPWTRTVVEKNCTSIPAAMWLGNNRLRLDAQRAASWR